jgi:hypothetical protein
MTMRLMADRESSGCDGWWLSTAASTAPSTREHSPKLADNNNAPVRSLLGCDALHPWKHTATGTELARRVPIASQHLGSLDQPAATTFLQYTLDRPLKPPCFEAAGQHDKPPVHAPLLKPSFTRCRGVGHPQAPQPAHDGAAAVNSPTDAADDSD